ncbi:DMT family transporter [Haliovirga abyssi]|uniref:Transporter YbhF n=1 Tax=Haliovirga abyssi TaxID=2996794 RepID=A0AAU9E4Z5_9FUSO|nr:DMT family transporter [Haliovirga abyssi]BDU51600.1 putative transporter YbhF [Haliovirga abyssi]
MKNNIILGHLMTLMTIFIWGVTFVSTKVLLVHLTPIEILFYRFLVAYILLLVIYPKIKKVNSAKEEILFFFLGFFGIFMYFLLENIALKYTLASNVGLFMSTIPIITSLIVVFGTKDEKFRKELIYGFLIAIIGVFLIIFNGKFILKLNPIGDILALIAALSFSIYSNLLKKINNKYNYLFITRKIFFYGIICMIPIIFLKHEQFSPNKLLIPEVFWNIVFLGVAASTLCFVMWNKAVSIIGAIKASNYIYLVPIITIGTSVLIINETITIFIILGGILTLSGVYISEKGFKIIKIKK